ncbi:MAG: glycosyltransferase [Sinobacteraceae bacterium]|nr:glycosyltransferase [Nevskiaceae bacterium]
MKLSPVALFVYRRPRHTRRTVEALLANHLAPQTDLYIFADGPRDPSMGQAVAEVRKYIRTIDGFRSVSVYEREENLGLANSVIEGVSRLCKEHGRVIVLEDDLVTAPGFLSFMNEALTRYENDDRVMQISGHMFPVKFSTTPGSVIFPFPTSWGWATWARSWKWFDRSAFMYSILKRDARLRRKFNLYGAYDYFSILENQLEGRVDSWAIYWYCSIFQRNGLVVYPGRSLVSNIGFDGTGEHCSRLDNAHDSNDVFESFRKNGATAFREVEVSRFEFQVVCDYLASHGSISKRLLYFLRKLFP